MAHTTETASVTEYADDRGASLKEGAISRTVTRAEVLCHPAEGVEGTGERMQSLENDALEEEWEMGRKKAILFAQSLATTQYDLALPKEDQEKALAARTRADDEMKRKAKEKEERMAAALAAAEAALEVRRRAEAEAEAERIRQEEERLAAEAAAEWARIQAESAAAQAMLKDVLNVAEMKAQEDAIQLEEEDRFKAETEAREKREAVAALAARESEKQRLAAEAAAAAEAEAEAERQRPAQEAQAAKQRAIARLEETKAKADAAAAAAAEAEAGAARLRLQEEQELRRAQSARKEARQVEISYEIARGQDLRPRRPKRGRAPTGSAPSGKHREHHLPNGDSSRPQTEPAVLVWWKMAAEPGTA